MKALIEDGDLAEAHRRQWAPFVIVAAKAQRPGRAISTMAKMKQTEAGRSVCFAALLPGHGEAPSSAAGAPPSRGSAEEARRPYFCLTATINVRPKIT